MADSSYRIYPDWKDTLVYDEGDGLALRFDCDCVEPYQVSVPTVDLWPHKTPPWAHDRREIILDRLRAARCIICETGLTTSSTFSPDGTFRVEVYFEYDERGYPFRAIRVFTIPGNIKLIDLDDASPAGPISFPQPGLLTLPFSLRNNRYQIGVNVAERTFWFHPTEEPRPLDQLLPSLNAEPQRLSYMPPTQDLRPKARSVVGAAMLLAISLLFVGGGIFMCIVGTKPHDRTIGVLGIVLFGSSAIVWFNDLRRWVKGRKQIR